MHVFQNVEKLRGFRSSW